MKTYQQRLDALGLQVFVDSKRHLVCTPYTVANLHKMAKVLGIKRCWFHKTHYDVPQIQFRVWQAFKANGTGIFATWVTQREIVKIIRTKPTI